MDNVYLIRNLNISNNSNKFIIMKKQIVLTLTLVFFGLALCHSQGTWKEYRDEVNTGIIRGGNNMSFFTEAKDGSIWASNTTGSLVRIQDDGVTIYDDMKRSIASQTNIGVIVEARERNIGVMWESAADMETGWVWFVSNRGIALWDGQVLMHATDETDELNRMIFFSESTEKNYIIEGKKTKEIADVSVKVRNPIINMFTVLVDSEGRAWFGGFKGKLYSIWGGVWTEYNQIQDYSRAEVNDKTKSIQRIYEDSKGQIWFVSNAFVTHFADDEFIMDETLPILEGANNIVEDKNGNMWMGTKTGAQKYDGQEWTFYGKDHGLEKIQFAGSIDVDSKGNIWYLSTTNGMYTKAGFVFKYDGTSWEKFKIGKKSILVDMMVDDRDRIWVSESRGIYVYENNEWVQMRDCSAMRMFMKVYQDKKGRIWVGRGSFTGEIDLYTE